MMCNDYFNAMVVVVVRGVVFLSASSIRLI